MDTQPQVNGSNPNNSTPLESSEGLKDSNEPTDMWTATHQKRGFMAVTTHFIDQNWNMQSRIMRKLAAVTVDNCNTNEAIIKILLERFPLKSLMMNGELFHMRCCAYILNIIVQDGLSIIGDGITKIRDSVSFWTASPKRVEKFENSARQLGIAYKKKLVLDCKTRWNSTFLMLSCAIEYKEVFIRLKLRESRYTSLPTELEWGLAKEICERLQLFYKVTVMFSGSKYPTANVFFPLICEIGYSLREWSESLVDVIKDMASCMLVKFEKYWYVIHGIMGMAAVLDPRYKLKFVELLLPVLYGEDNAKVEFQKLEVFVKTLFKEYESTRPTRNENEGVSGSSFSSSFSSGLSSGHRGGFKKILSDIASIASEYDDVGDTTELDNYLKEKLSPKDVELDLLVWWKTNGFRYPTLQRVAKDILAVPVSTVASESAFSTSGRLISPHHSRLHPKTLEALMCAQSWLLNEIRETCSAETEAYCRSIDYDSDVEEVPLKENGTSLDDFD